MTDRFQRVEQLFHAALGVDAGRRAAFVREQAGDDAALAAEVGALLQADADVTSGAAPERDPLAPLPEALRLAAAGDAMIGRTVGAWRIGPLLGEGGMGRVYLASRADAAF